MNFYLMKSKAKFLISLILAVAQTMLFFPAFQSAAAARSIQSPAPAECSFSAAPVFAYYYIWFTKNSWDRAKIDYPLLGRYDSGDWQIMRQHIRWAKQAGIDGFIVSWKSTTALNERLAQLIELSEKEDFRLIVIYQGLTFERQPRGSEVVLADLDYFIKNFAPANVFQVCQKPIMILNGTWAYSEEEIKAITDAHRQDLYILSSEKTVDGFKRLADLVDGNAYYWSSVDPDTYTNYLKKLTQMGQAVHDKGGIWLPSAAPGFDARLVGGMRVIDRKDGATLRVQMETALKSSPDILGLISWNEFSENTHIEPSERFGMSYLELLTEIVRKQEPIADSPVILPTQTTESIPQFTPLPTIMDFDSSEISVGQPTETTYVPDLGFDRILSLAFLLILVLGGLVVIIIVKR